MDSSLKRPALPTINVTVTSLVILLALIKQSQLFIASQDDPASVCWRSLRPSHNRYCYAMHLDMKSHMESKWLYNSVRKGRGERNLFRVDWISFVPFYHMRPVFEKKNGCTIFTLFSYNTLVLSCTRIFPIIESWCCIAAETLKEATYGIYGINKKK